MIDTSNSNTKRHYGHRSTRSVSSLPVDLQSLSLEGPEDIMIQDATGKPQEPSFNPIPSYDKPITAPTIPFNGTPFAANEKPPSWMLPVDRVQPASNSNQRRSRLGHGRSVSEFTLPPLSYTAAPSLTPPPPPSATTSLQCNNNNLITPPPRRHRRAVSANTVDFMLTPSPISFDRSQSHSPQEVTMITNLNASNNNHHSNNNTTSFFEPIITDTNNSKSSGEGRYVCPYCQKKFSRPSSLRIHTYSHTGEKPFVCTEPGCGRHFSVQSNMRRHLRVHRLGRSVNNINEESEA